MNTHKLQSRCGVKVDPDDQPTVYATNHRSMKRVAWAVAILRVTTISLRPVEVRLAQQLEVNSPDIRLLGYQKCTSNILRVIASYRTIPLAQDEPAIIKKIPSTRN